MKTSNILPVAYLVVLVLIGIATKTALTGAFYSVESGGGGPISPVFSCSDYDNDQASCESYPVCIWASSCTLACASESPGGPSPIDVLATCDDGDACTTDSGDEPDCIYTPITCDDADACTEDSCDPATGCVFTPITCDDADACTENSCDTVLGCTYTPVSCFDGDSCTTDTCDSVTGCVYGAEICDDADACTEDSCDTGLGCIFTPITCDDADACTTDTCDSVFGCVYTPLDCDDSDPCTNDTCDAIMGCINEVVTCDGTNQDTCEATGCVWNSNCTTNYAALCETELTEDTTLSDHMECDGVTALIVGTDNITIDCDGYSINGTGSATGIDISSHTGITIKNCDISNFQYGVYIYDSNYIYTLNNNISYNQYGIYIEGVYRDTPVEPGGGDIFSNHIVQGNNINSNSISGIYIQYEDNVTVRDNTIECASTSGPYTGIELNLLQGNNILTGNEVYNCNYGLNASNLVRFTSTNDNYHHDGYGIYLSGVGNETDYPVFSNVKANDNYYTGVYAGDGSVVQFINPELSRNQEAATGLHVSNATVYLTNGKFIDNVGYGIFEEIPIGPPGDGHCDRVCSIYWTITDATACINNDISIFDGWVSILGGTLTATNCDITVAGETFDTSIGQTGYTQKAISIIPAGNDIVTLPTVEATIYSDSGYDGTLTITSYDQLPSGVSGYGLEALGTWVTFDAPGLNENMTWAIIKIRYTDAQLTAAGIDESTLVIKYLNATSNAWETYDPPRGGVDMVDNSVWANVTHFSGFGIFGSATAATVGSSVGGSALPSGTTITWAGETSQQSMKVGDTLKFSLGGTNHTAKLSYIGSNYVTLYIASTPQSVTVKLGETMNIDVDRSGTFDITATLDKIESGKAYITFTKYVAAGEQPAAEQPSGEPSAITEKPTQLLPEIAGLDSGKLATIIVLGSLAVLAVIYFVAKPKK